MEIYIHNLITLLCHSSMEIYIHNMITLLCHLCSMRKILVLFKLNIKLQILKGNPALRSSGNDVRFMWLLLSDWFLRIAEHLTKPPIIPRVQFSEHVHCTMLANSKQLLPNMSAACCCIGTTLFAPFYYSSETSIPQKLWKQHNCGLLISDTV
jgi:hypothetical protein